MKNRTHWKWFAWGKHPGLEDFVWAGTHTPLFQRFTKWVDNGFTMFKTDAELRSRHRSWRFWTKGAGSEVVCGLVRNSCDTHGRSFPLLYIGTGALEDWSNNCSMMPFAFESAWKSFEYVASARFEAMQQLDDSLQLIQPPEPDWRKYQQRIYNTTNVSRADKCQETIDNGKRLLTFDCKLPENLPYEFLFCQRVAAMEADQSPLAVFIGEIEGRIAVAIMNSALTPTDFQWLWTVDRHGRQPENHPAIEGKNGVQL